MQAVIRLGGATSAPQQASFSVFDGRKNLVATAALEPIEAGLYHVYFSIKNFAEGRYEIRLRYPRASFAAEFPFWVGEITESRFIAVAP